MKKHSSHTRGTSNMDDSSSSNDDNNSDNTNSNNTGHAFITNVTHHYLPGRMMKRNRRRKVVGMIVVIISMIVSNTMTKNMKFYLNLINGKFQTTQGVLTGGGFKTTATATTNVTNNTFHNTRTTTTTQRTNNSTTTTSTTEILNNPTTTIAHTTSTTTSTTTTTSKSNKVVVKKSSRDDDNDENKNDEKSPQLQQLQQEKVLVERDEQHLFSIENLDLTKSILCGDAKCYIQAKRGIILSSNIPSLSGSDDTIDNDYIDFDHVDVGFLVMQDEFRVIQRSPTTIIKKENSTTIPTIPVIDIWNQTYHLGELIQSRTTNNNSEQQQQQRHIMIGRPYIVQGGNGQGTKNTNVMDEIIQRIVENDKRNNNTYSSSSNKNKKTATIVPRFVRGSTKEEVPLHIIQERFVTNKDIVVQMVYHLHPTKYVLFGCTTNKFTQFWSKIDQLVVQQQQSPSMTETVAQHSTRHHDEQSSSPPLKERQLISVLDGFRSNFGNLMSLLRYAPQELNCIINDFQIFVNIQLPPSPPQQQEQQEQQETKTLHSPSPGQIIHFDLDRCYADRHGFYKRNGQINPATKRMKDKLQKCYQTTNQRLLDYIENITAAATTTTTTTTTDTATEFPETTTTIPTRVKRSKSS